MIWEVDAEVAGGLGRQMDYEHSRTPSLVGHVHYVFDGWFGDDLVTTPSFWLVSERLAAALRDSELTGFELEDALITVSDTWRSFKGDTDPGVWLRLVPTGNRDDGSDFFTENNGTRLFISDRAAAFLQKFTIEDGQLRPESEPEPENEVFEEFMRRRGGDLNRPPDHSDLPEPPPNRFADVRTTPVESAEPRLTAEDRATTRTATVTDADTIELLTYSDLTGDLRTLIDAMRQKTDSTKFHAALSLLGAEDVIPSPESGDFGGFDSFSNGLSLITEKGKLYQVLLYLEPKAKATGGYEAPWVCWRLLTLETRMGLCRENRRSGSRRRVATARRRRPLRCGWSERCGRSWAPSTGRCSGSRRSSATESSPCVPG